MKFFRIFVFSISILSSNFIFSQNYALRFFGNGINDIDRVKIPIDNPPKAVDVDFDFTIEFQIKAELSDNPLGSIVHEGNNDSWVFGHVIIDRDIFGNGENGDYGVSLANGKIAFGVNNGTNSYTTISNLIVADGFWHYVAITRNGTSGEVQIFIDGILDKSVLTNVLGDISYLDNRQTDWENDPFIVIGAEKHDYDNLTYPSFSGVLDELRFSNIVRYGNNYIPSVKLFDDINTVALYHFDEGQGIIVNDLALISGNQSNGYINYGGNPYGPIWVINELEESVKINNQTSKIPIYCNFNDNKIEISSYNIDFHVYIINSKGQIIINEKKLTCINVEFLDSGIYFIKIIDSNIIYSNKFVVL